MIKTKKNINGIETNGAPWDDVYTRSIIYKHEYFEHNILHKKILLSQSICHMFTIEGT